MTPLAILLPPASATRRALRTLALTCFLGIVIAGSIPGARASVGNYAPAYLLHGTTYAGLAALWFLASTGTPWLRALLAILVIALMGAIDEGVQTMVPYRSGDVRDWLVDVMAAAATASLLAVLATRLPLLQSPPLTTAPPRGSTRRTRS